MLQATVKSGLIRLPLDFALTSASDDEELDAGWLESILEEFDCSAYLDGASAIEQVHSRVAVLGPGVNRVVRLLNDHRTAHSIRLEFLKAVGNDSCFGDICGGDHRLAKGVMLLQGTTIASKEFDE